ncbi:cyclophilin-like fold protein [Streptomyces sp. NPDC057575]|uniref:cyclophilin-like fold protein n=1 Tax=unclassified Streptomyces TaxID=2593676 RepID=UPI0036B1704B
MPRGLLRLAAATALAAAVTAAPSVPSAPASLPPAAPSAPSRKNNAMDLRVTLAGQPVDATLNDSPAARDLASLLPLTLDLEDFHDTERIGHPPRALTTDGAPAPDPARAGDIAYFAPWGSLALFYQDGPPAADLLVLGHIDAAVDLLSRAERITLAPDMTRVRGARVGSGSRALPAGRVRLRSS